MTLERALKLWPVVVATLAVLGFKSLNPAQRLNALEMQVSGVQQVQVIVNALARLECRRVLLDAELAGIPCAQLVKGER